MIVTDIKVYNGDTIHKRFAYRYHRDKVIPTGNIIAFRSPMDVTINLIDLEDSLSNDFIWSDDAINFCWELPLCNNGFGAVAFQRLFNTQIANILHSLINAPIEMRGDDLIVHKTHEQGGIAQPYGKASVSITHVKDGAALGHTAINIKSGKKAPAFAFSTHLTDEQIQKFMMDVCSIFYALADELFVASSKVQV